MSKVRALINYLKIHGVRNTFFYALYRIFPNNFSLLAYMIKNRNLDHVTMNSNDYKVINQSTIDYKSWIDYGGRSKPIYRLADSKTYIWFVPDWLNVWGGGHYTLFRFAQHFAEKTGFRQIIYVYNNQRHKNSDYLQRDLNRAFKNCKLDVVVHAHEVPFCDVAFATTWQSAYDVRAFPFSDHKFYFMQDYESFFYAHGTDSMQANNTYSFGFKGITGGTWLRSIFESYGGVAENYRFAADRDIFYPESENGIIRPDVKKIFFYGRPSTERRCFELGIASLNKIYHAYPDIEIVIAGLNLASPPPFKATLLGNLTLRETGELYRTCDIGIAFSGTNLSYLPVELMASGVPVVSNKGPQVEWHCRNRENSLVVDPTPSSVFEAVEELIKDSKLRQLMAHGGIETMRPISWSGEMDKILNFVLENTAKK